VAPIAKNDENSEDIPTTVLICHADDSLNREGLARWLAATTRLSGIVILDEPRARLWKRVRREVQRIGVMRFIDVLAFRVYQALFLSRANRIWEQRMLDLLCQRFEPIPSSTQYCHSTSPNTQGVEAFIRELNPDIVIARCKTLLKERVFTLPSCGTFVMHPGICPQYRNAHGCFWALAQNDRENVGMTLLKIDRGVDTGPVYGYFRCDFDEFTESHTVIQHKVVFSNLDALQDKLLNIYRGSCAPIAAQHTTSREWGQPWLTCYLRYIARGKRRVT
jgi:hypothetical protein